MAKTLGASGAKERIVQVAADLMHVQGVAGTSIDEILEASGTGKSQFYHYFENKSSLVHEVLSFQFRRYIAAQEPFIEKLTTWKGVRSWLDQLVSQYKARDLIGGCPLGSLAAEMADRDESLRKEVAAAFREWEGYLARGLEVLKEGGHLRKTANCSAMAETTMAMIQGGYLLANTKKDLGPMQGALDAAYAFLRTFR
ncbi:MAG: TetR/AcrR family transcriptional regulator [Actinomycetota bacterium]|nr:TetR/AcrR family transcriptional regulator [Actinomycetota bacterium]